MGSSIEWTDETWNPTVGCSKVSPGCDGCYAIGVAHRAMQPAHEGLTIKRPGERPDWNGTVRCLPERLDTPLRWRKPRRVFVDSMSDLFHPNVPDEFIGSVWATMAAASQHTFQVLTKRPQRMREVLSAMEAHTEGSAYGKPIWRDHQLRWNESKVWPVPNVWLGTSIESDRYTFRADHLRATPAAVRFLSLEPLLGPLPSLDLTGIDWVIVGGESGPGARPMHPDWVSDLLALSRLQGSGLCPECNGDQSIEVDPGGFAACPTCYSEEFGGPTGRRHVPFFFKQWGSWAPAPWKLQRGIIRPDGMVGHEEFDAYKARSEAEAATHSLSRDGHLRPLDHQPWSIERTGPIDGSWTAGVRNVGKKAAGRVLDGRTWDEFPKAVA